MPSTVHSSIPSLLLLLLITLCAFLSPIIAGCPPEACICNIDPNSVQCILCGDPNSSGNICTAFNATYDDLKTKQFTNYQGFTYTNFTAVTSNRKNPIKPATPKKMIRAPPAGGSLMFEYSPTGSVGRLFSFSYACGKPSGKAESCEAVACNVTVVAHTFDYNNVDEDVKYNGTFAYQPDVKQGAAMMVGDFGAVTASAVLSPPGADANPYNILWLEFSAVQADGSSAFLYLDELLMTTLCIGCGPG